MDDWVKKLHICTHTQWNIIQPYYKEDSAICNIIDELEGIMLSGISQTQKEKSWLISPYMLNLKKSNIKKQRVEWWLPGVGDLKGWGDGDQRYKVAVV